MPKTAKYAIALLSLSASLTLPIAAQAQEYQGCFMLTSSPPYKCRDSSPRLNLRIGGRSLNGVDVSTSCAGEPVLPALYVRFKSQNVLPRLIQNTMQLTVFLLLGRIFAVALAAFSTPALTVAVSTCLEPRGRRVFALSTLYQKAVLEGRGLYPILLVS